MCVWVCVCVYGGVWKGDNYGSFGGGGKEGRSVVVGSAGGEPLHLQLNYKLQVYTLYAYT